MTARTAAYDPQTRDGVLVDYPVIASEIIYKGTPVFIRAASGHAYSNDGTTNSLALGDQFVGIADQTVDNSSGAAAAKNVVVRTQGLFNLPLSGTVTQAKSGDPVFVNEVTDDSTVTLSSDLSVLEVQIGELQQYIDSDNGLVRIDGFVGAEVGYGAVLPTLVEGNGGEGRSTVKVAKATYDFSVDGGAIGTISLGVQIPSGAIIRQAYIQVVTPLTSGGSATVAFNSEAAGDLLSATAFDNTLFDDAGIKALIPVGTAATMVAMTANRTLQITIADAALTAGKLHVIVEYII